MYEFAIIGHMPNYLCIRGSSPRPCLPMPRERSPRGPKWSGGSHRLLKAISIFWSEAACIFCIELLKSMPLVCCTCQKPDLKVRKLPAHLQKDKYLNQAPQALEVGVTTKNQQS